MAGDDSERPTIPQFYSGRTLFITGFTGFMGKVLVEKLLYTCPNIKAIYVLLRGKRGLSPQQRIDKITNSDLFQTRLTKDLTDKVKPLNGDVTLPRLGLTDEQWAFLEQEVSVVFHCAASVRFDDALTKAIDINVRGTKTMVELALGMTQLVAFVHVSTAYANCDRFEIEEKMYPPHADWSDCLRIRDSIDELTFNTLTTKYVNNMPNTYVFAKSLGEHIVSDHADRLPAVIFRPSIGWIDNLNGPVGLLAGFGTGVARTCLVDSSIQPDFIPVDIAIRGLIISAYTRVYRKVDGLHHYNWCTRDRSITNREMIEMGKRLIVDAPMKLKLWHPTTHTTSSYTWFYINFVLFQMVPAFFIDIVLRIAGKEPMLWKLQRKIFIAMSALSYFVLNTFTFHNSNSYDLENYVLPEDMKEFRYILKPEEVDEYRYFYNACVYFQKRFLKMKPKDFRMAKIIAIMFQYADWIVKASFWLSLSWFVYSYQIVPSVLYNIYTFVFNF